ncbi:1081_t:CDS:2 [Entrophospora sp. SA101]|nr:8203_t:CDS:2 [Entrophospora sp. SA101]CAJ0841715.1 1081_t:CDS:2 [Entrophospora sp. SA101]
MTGSLVIASLPSIGKHNHQISTLSGIEGNFTLSTFDSFINIYKTSHHLASEAEKAFDVLIDSLNEGTDIVRAKSKYYNAPAFSDIAINMNEEEAKEYNTIDVPSESNGV